MKIMKYLFEIVLFLFVFFETGQRMHVDIYATTDSTIEILLLENETEHLSYDWQNELDYGAVQNFLEDTFDTESIQFSDFVKQLLSGKSEHAVRDFLETIKGMILNEVTVNGALLKNIILIGLFAAVFTNFSSILGNQNISETGFFISYMVLITLLLSSFDLLSEIATVVLTNVLDFMKALLPVYMVSLGLNLGQGGAIAYYNMALVIISIINALCLHLLLPAVEIFMLLSLVNNISKEDIISKGAELIKKLVNYALNGLFAIVTGMNVIQSMLLPVTGSIRNQAASSVLGIMSGGMANNITGLAYGTANAVKSGIGTAGMLILVAIVTVPILKVLVFILGYNVTTVMLQPITDKRIIKSIEAVADGATLLLKCIFVCTFMLILTIAIICLTTNQTV